jgi:hypothetical protein
MARRCLLQLILFCKRQQQNNQGQWRARISAHRHLQQLRKKTLEGDDELGGSSAFITTEEKQSRMTTSQDSSSLSSSTSEEKSNERWQASRLVIVFYKWGKKLRDDDELGVLSSFLATQEKPISRYFFLGYTGRWWAKRLVVLFWVSMFSLFFFLSCRRWQWMGML